MPLWFLKNSTHSLPWKGWVKSVREWVSVCRAVSKSPAPRLIHSVNYLWSEISLGWKGRAGILFRWYSASALGGSCLRSWSRLISASLELFANNTALREKRLLTTEHLLRRNDLLICWGVENQGKAGAWYIGEIYKRRQECSWDRI